MGNTVPFKDIHIYIYNIYTYIVYIYIYWISFQLSWYSESFLKNTRSFQIGYQVETCETPITCRMLPSCCICRARIALYRSLRWETRRHRNDVTTRKLEKTQRCSTYIETVISLKSPDYTPLPTSWHLE